MFFQNVIIHLWNVASKHLSADVAIQHVNTSTTYSIKYVG